MKKMLSILMLTAFGLGAIPMTASTSFAKSRVPQKGARHAIVVSKHRKSRKLCLSDELAARKSASRKGRKGRAGRRVSRRKTVTPKPAPAQAVK